VSPHGGTGQAPRNRSPPQAGCGEPAGRRRKAFVHRTGHVVVTGQVLEPADRRVPTESGVGEVVVVGVWPGKDGGVVGVQGQGQA
jgi:hypothetical protein